MRIAGLEIGPEAENRPLNEVLADVDIIDVGDSYIIASKRLDEPVVTELGAKATRWRRGILGAEEYNSEVAGNEGIQLFDRMKRSDSSVRGSLRIAKTPVLAGRWYVDPASDNASDVLIAEFIQKNLFKWMSIGWTQFMSEALLMLDYGYYLFEKVFQLREYQGEMRWTWKKFSPRHPLDVVDFDFATDGGVTGVNVDSFEGDAEIFIPVDKLLIFSYDMEAGNVEGISALRSAYKHWYYKENLYKIDGIQKERHGIGIPVIKLPPNWNEKDKNLANELGRNLRSNEQAHIVLPPMWEIEFADVRGNPVNVLESIEHHDVKILENVLAGFAMKTEKADAEIGMTLFMKASRFIADIFREVINRHAIPELVNYNWADIDEYPELKVRRIGEVEDWRTLTFALRNAVGADLIRGDDPTEDWLREEFDMLKRDASTAREPRTGGNQLRPSRQTQPSSTPPRSTGGTDQSGGN